MSAPVRAAIEQNLAGDPVRIALDKRIPHPALVATQVKYLKRAKSKLPAFYAAQCVIPPLAFEQSSSEATAANKQYSGAVCVDLTCGLGVDSFAFSKCFDRVIAVEKDPDLAYIAETNFKLLGASNICVVNSGAEEFIAANPDLRADLVYIDPDRRAADGKKLVRLEDCLPDVAVLMPALRNISDRVVVKLSPLFDVDEAFRIFGPSARVEAVSLDGECKEVLVETGAHIPSPVIAATAVGFGTVEYPYIKGIARGDAAPDPAASAYLIVPDVALAKARIARRYFTDADCRIESDNSYAFSHALPTAFPGKAYRIVKAEPYSPKKLKKALKESGIGRINILKRDFPYSTETIARHLGIKEGGTVDIAFTEVSGSPWAVFVGAP